ncbi:response regulator [Tunicatimonas pelagia]|uniref:response regulator n=1 Tax=Tunicatimonas pelagia TaxID=931531 RepID=UPI0026671944|nr:response regulator [Tunicatimonas pelagia]WKN41978.1 response regulator [Tunicatimonas pelagia]
MVRVLLIDDDEINNFTVEAVLGKVDFIKSYEIKESGWEALDYLRKCEEENHFPDLIFVDINMPEMDGHEFIERYEEAFWNKHPTTKISMLSSSISESDRKKSMAYSSVSEYAFKPLTKEKLTTIAS